RWEDFHFKGEMLAPGESAKKGLAIDFEGKVEGVFAVEQVLTTATAPVKQISQIELGQHSHRTFKDLKPRFIKDKKEEPKNEAEKMEGQGAGKDNMPKDNMPKDNMPIGQKKTEDEKAKKANRYSDSTPQFRKMPVAMVLLVDQDSANYVLTA